MNLPARDPRVKIDPIQDNSVAVGIVGRGDSARFFNLGSTGDVQAMLAPMQAMARFAEEDELY